MVKRVEIGEMGQEVRQFFEELAAGGESYLLMEDQGKPVAGVVPPWQVSHFEDQRQQLMTMLKDVWARNRDVPPNEIEQEVEAAVREFRGEPGQ